MTTISEKEYLKARAAEIAEKARAARSNLKLSRGHISEAKAALMDIQEQAEGLGRAIEEAMDAIDRAHYQHPEDRPGI